MKYKILCTGNPAHFTVARGVKQIFSEADFACRATGYDLRMWEPATEQHFRDNIINYNVLINSSSVSNGAQQKILEITNECWQGKIGYVFNIGSTAEYEGRNSFFPTYSVQKRALRDLSLSLCSSQFRTTHMTVGGLNDGKPENKNNLDTLYIAKAIEWILTMEVHIPIIGIEQLYVHRE